MPHNRIIMDLLFELATWHALAKLRLHMETTLRALDTSTKRLGDALRTFKKVTCVVYITKELPSEEAARGQHQATTHKTNTIGAISMPAGSKREKHFNLSTYKLHALGDYAIAIRMFGTTDGYTTQVVSS
jgi:hypothetical protein